MNLFTECSLRRCNNVTPMKRTRRRTRWMRAPSSVEGCAHTDRIAANTTALAIQTALRIHYMHLRTPATSHAGRRAASRALFAVNTTAITESGTLH